VDFAHPHALWLMLLLPALAWYDAAWGAKARAKFRFSSLALVRGASARRGPDPAAALRLAVLGLLIVALARPQRGQKREEVTSPATDILLAVDTSGSMEALDFDPKNRLEGAQEVIRRFVDQRPHDRIGLVVFSGLALTQCPLTLDHGALLGFLDRLRIGMIEEDGTAVGTAIMTAAARLKDSEAKSKVIVLLTDGRNNRGEVDPLTAAQAAAGLGVKIYAVGAGRPGGSLYPVQDPLFGRRLVRRPEELDEETLQRVAAAGGGRYFRATDLESLKEIYAEIDRLEKTDVKVETITDYRDLYLPFVLAAFALFMTEALLASTAWRRLP
jgi:Ca-activated chloride channel family protein